MRKRIVISHDELGGVHLDDYTAAHGYYVIGVLNTGTHYELVILVR